MQIFISYRRDDSAAHARLLHNELSGRFGSGSVFMDIDDIGYGDDFVRAIDEHIDRSDVVVIVIGLHWAEMLEQRLRGDDWVRHEVRRALERQAAGRAAIVPVRIGPVPWPPAHLPPDVAGLAHLVQVPYDERDLKGSIARVVEAVRHESFEDEVDRRRRQRQARGAAVVIGLLLFVTGWLALLDRLTVDTRAAGLTMAVAARLGGTGPDPWSGQVLVLAIDAATEARLGRPFDASWRAEHAQVIENAASAGARSIAFDAVLEDAGPEDANLRLEQALDAVRGRLPVAFAVQGARQGRALMLERFRPRVLQGVACVGAKLGKVRTVPLAVQAPGGGASAPAPRPSLALAAFLGGGSLNPLNELAQELDAVRLPGPEAVTLGYFAAESVRAPRTACPVIAPGDRVALQLLDPQRLPMWRQAPQRLAYERVLAAEAEALAGLKDKIVLVGLMRDGDDDIHPVGAAGGDANRWGVELIASQIDALLARRALRAADGTAEALGAAASALAGVSIAIALRRRARAWRAVALTLASVTIVLLAALWYRSEQQLINWPYPLLALLAGASITTAWLQRGR